MLDGSAKEAGRVALDIKAIGGVSSLDTMDISDYSHRRAVAGLTLRHLPMSNKDVWVRPDSIAPRHEWFDVKFSTTDVAFMEDFLSWLISRKQS